jgi:hypothetical protein
LKPPVSDAETLQNVPSQSVTQFEPTQLPSEFGGYRLTGMLGRGGMGAVFEAEQLSTGRRVALKMLGQQLDSPEMRKRFLREGRLAAGINHPNSLYIFGSEEIEGVPVIVMEIAASGTLRDKLKKRGPLPITGAVDAVLDLIAGLEAALARGVLHRDIKPSNCFVGKDGSVKIGDFGLSVSTFAKDDSYVTATGVIMGTPAYASPEQLRGDDLDVRADIYSVGATLFTLITGRAPFEGDNAAQVVTNVVSQKPTPMGTLRKNVPPGLEQVVARCLSKGAEQRYSDYRSLRNALLPFSSREPEPASVKVRAPAGWIDYLVAFLVPYVALTLLIGNEEFHFRFIMDRTLYSARHYLAFLGFGFLYFSLVEGIWGAGFGKRFKGLAVVRSKGGRPGIARAFLRILIPVLSIEIVRIPLLMASIRAVEVEQLTTSEVLVYSVATTLCPLIPVLFLLTARRENGFATLWDLASGTRVVVRPEGRERPSIRSGEIQATPDNAARSLGPYLIVEELVPGGWLVARDPVLRRQVWLLRRDATEISSRRHLARPGRLRWLQKLETNEVTWDAFGATPGVAFSNLVEEGKAIPWARLRHWLHDLAAELWKASGDLTLPEELSIDNVWITKSGQAVLLDQPWPGVSEPAERIKVQNVHDLQRFLDSVAANVDKTSLPLHARPVLQNLRNGKFEKLSFLTGTLGGLLDKPADVSRGIRAGAIFMLPFYIGIMIFVGSSQGAEWLYEMIGDSFGSIAIATFAVVIAGSALIQLLAVPFRTTFGHSIFRLAVVNDRGEPAGLMRLFFRWVIAWLPLLVPVSFVAIWSGTNATTAAVYFIVAWLLLWLGGVLYSVIQPNRGLHDRWSDTWVVRR